MSLAGQRAKKERTKCKPMRGAVWPLKVEDIDPPKKGMEPVPMETSSEPAPHFFEHMETLMIDPGGEEASLEETEYNNPALEDPVVALAMVARLWKPSMLKEIDSLRFLLLLFTVVKKVVTEDEVERVPLRLILD